MSTLPNQVITMDQAYLDQAKLQLSNPQSELQPALSKLLETAAALLPVKSESVTYKTIVPPSGNKADYMSLAPYWWPNPDTADGLPYVQRDGQFNPSSKNGDSDSVRMQQMCMSAQHLSLAWFLSGEQQYADKAAEVIRTWFLDPATRMNPHLDFGQAVMGVNSGRGIGLIDSRNFWMVIDAALMLASAGIMAESELADLRSWFGRFASWMQESKIGIEESIEHNNHGTCYDMQLACYLIFNGQTEQAARVVERAYQLRIRAQIALDGQMHAELERTTPFHYTAFNLDFMQNLARYGEQVGVDVWHRYVKSRNLRRGIDYMAKYATRPQDWPHKELREMESELALPVLLRAERAYRSGEYGKLVADLPERKLDAQEWIALHKATGTPHPTTLNSIDRLIWPILPPVLK